MWPPSNDKAAAEDGKAAKEAATNAQNATKVQGEQDKYQKYADDRQKNRRETLDDSNTSDYMDTALSQAYKILFQNAGVSHRLGRAGQQAYSSFLQSLEPGSVQSCEPKTFFWVDGSGRPHMVTGVVCIESAQNQQLRVTPKTLSQEQALTTQAQTQYTLAQTHSLAAQGNHTTSKTEWDLWVSTWHIPHLIAAFKYNFLGDTDIDNANNALTQAIKARSQWMEGEAGRDKNHSEENANGKPKESSNSGDDSDDILMYVNDIHHTRTVQAMTFQFHMGSPVKSIYGDIDTMTFYPPVQSSAVATFNYTGEGNIHRSGSEEGSDPKHECGLIAAF
jgi:hypothetical protein